MGVPRGPTSQADQDLLAALQAAGIDWVTEYQLERWRQAGALPAPVRRFLGRGKGSTSVYPPEAAAVAKALANHTYQGRSLHYAVLASFRESAPVPEPAVRRSMQWIVEADRQQARRAAADNEDAVANRAARARQATTWAMALPLLAEAPLQGGSRRQRSARAARRRVLGGVAADAVLMQYEEEPMAVSDMASETLAAFGHPDAAEIGAAVRAGEAEGSYHHLLSQRAVGDAIAQSRFDRLCAASEAIKAAATYNYLLTFFAAFYEPVRNVVTNVAHQPMGTWCLAIPPAFSRPETAPAAFTSLCATLAGDDVALVTLCVYSTFVQHKLLTPMLGFGEWARRSQAHPDSKGASMPDFDVLTELGTRIRDQLVDQPVPPDPLSKARDLGLDDSEAFTRAAGFAAALTNGIADPSM